ncbi:hypothetical protein JCM8547_004378 [Rhodosporidiobolus lusitaniae]
MSSAQASGSSGKGTAKLDKNGQPKKKSQRPSWSCTECTRRKIRCDRVVPGCSSCIKRGKVHLCRLDQDAEIGFAPGGSSVSNAAADPSSEIRYASQAEYDSILRNINVVRQRLHHLDRVVRAFVPQPDILDEQGQASWAIDMGKLQESAKPDADYQVGPDTSGFYDIGTPSVGPTPIGGMQLPLPAQTSFGMDPNFPFDPLAVGQASFQSSQAPSPHLEPVREISESDNEVEAAVTLEFLALGRDRKQEHLSRSNLLRPASAEDEITTPALPTPSLAHPDPTASSLFSGNFDAGGLSNSPARPGTQHPSPATTAVPPHLSSLLDILPDQPTSDAIINFSVSRVAWQHGAVHAGTFRAEIAEFFSWGEPEKRATLVNQAWLALYFSMLCAGAKHMSKEDAIEFNLPDSASFPTEYHRSLPKLYFEASLDALHRSKFLANHSIFAVQTIVILAIACADVAGSDLISTLLASGIRIAEHLKLHIFSSDADWLAKRRANGVDSKSEQAIKGLIQREIRKRLWYALSLEDWFQIPYRRAYAVSPSYVTTPPPINCHDADLETGELVECPHDEPTVVSKLLVVYKIAAAVRTFFKHVNATPDKDLSYEALLEVDREIRLVIDSAPPFLKKRDETRENDPAYGFVQWLRRYFIMSVSHKLLICHRVFLGRAFRDHKYAYSRRSAIESARSIIQELIKGKSMPYNDVWTVPYHTLVAATTVLLDIFQSSSNDPDTANKRNEVQLALEELKLLDSEGNSQIAARGVKLLTTLLDEEAKHRRSSGFDARKRKAAELEGGTSTADEGFGDLAKRVVSNSRTPLSSSAAAPATPFFPLVSPSLATVPFPYFHPTSLPGQQHQFALPNPPPLPAGEAAASPVGSHVSDASLNQVAFDAILQNLAGWSAPDAVPAGGEQDGGLATLVGIDGEQDRDWWRMLDSNLEPTGGFDISTGFGTGLGGEGGPAPW